MAAMHSSHVNAKMAEAAKKTKSGLYDQLKDSPWVINDFVNATYGFGSAKEMNEDMKRDWLDQFTMQDVEVAYENGFL